MLNIWKICKEVIITITHRYLEDRVGDLAAQLAYYLLLSLFPFLMLAFTIIGYLPISGAELLETIHPYAPPSTYELIRSNLYGIMDQKSGKVLSISLVATIYIASLAFHSIIRILNNAYQVKQERTFWKQLWVGFFLMVGILIGLIVSLVVSIFGEVLAHTLFPWLGATSGFIDVWLLLRWSAGSMILFIVFFFLYVFAPHTHVGYRDALPGALLATFGWQISSYFFAIYVGRFGNYSLVYGNLGAWMVLLGWFYLSALILIIGGMFNATLCQIQTRMKDSKKEGG
ncbi:membrane protein [Thermoactinomyces sp. DSM 45891]|uniref:YihY/virulence factor BrkB family protein n=1 Tax=Thermoactinomyces sp. DSM 45891 TaxID=1761907 RepID=UPI00091151D8|nr:YihY/virulence factor BrkB family protein [Thermoactinomyces sp. DSM 45891]SFX41436.1 membrane protein [Thermoactinomyces sp. DSM 45891]